MVFHVFLQTIAVYADVNWFSKNLCWQLNVFVGFSQHEIIHSLNSKVASRAHNLIHGKQFSGRLFALNWLADFSTITDQFEDHEHSTKPIA